MNKVKIYSFVRRDVNLNEMKNVSQLDALDMIEI